MKKALCIIMVLSLMLAIPVFAQDQDVDPRLKELQTKYAELAKQKMEIEAMMLQVSGMFMERQRIVMEIAEPVDVLVQGDYTSDGVTE